MSTDQLKTDKNSTCKCPFCDEPICPDPADGRYSCNNDGFLKIHQVDCVGLYCPVPVMRAKEEIDLLEKGNLMELIADDPASAEDIPRWAKRTGHRLVSMVKSGDEYRFLIQKNNEEDE
jgi:tRNA 2-thiouridine synthesizing protein A